MDSALILEPQKALSGLSMNVMNSTHWRSTQNNKCIHVKDMSADEEFEEHTKEFIVFWFFFS